jgi:hypothetical protein
VEVVGKLCLRGTDTQPLRQEGSSLGSKMVSLPGLQREENWELVLKG